MITKETLEALIKQNESFAESEIVKNSQVSSNYVRGKIDAFKNLLMTLDINKER